MVTTSSKVTLSPNQYPPLTGGLFSCVLYEFNLMLESIDFISTAQATSFIWSSNIVTAMDMLIYEGFPPSEIMSAKWAYHDPFNKDYWEYSFSVS